MLRYKRMPKGIFIVRNQITLQAVILYFSGEAVQCHPFFSINIIIQQQVNKKLQSPGTKKF